MKKKLVVSTMAASLVFSSLAGLPMSTQGLLEKIGVSTAQAAAPTGVKTITDELNKIYSYLWTDEEKAPISQARAELNALGNNDSNLALVSEVTSRVNKKISESDDSGQFDQLSEKNILKLFSSLGLFFNAEGITDEKGDGTGLQDALVRKELRPILKQLAILGGVNPKDLTIDDAVAFATATEAALKGQIANLSFEQLAMLAAKEKDMKDIIKAAASNVMDNKTLKFSKVLSNIGITVEDVTAVTNKIVGAVDKDRAATTNIAIALLRSEANTTFARTSDYSENSLKQKYQFTILGKALPNILKWTSSNARISASYEEGKVALSMNVSGLETTVLEGKLNLPGTHLDGLVLVRKEVSLSFTPTSSGSGSKGGGGGGGGAISPSTGGSVGQAVADAQKSLEDLKKQLKDATGDKKQQLLDQAKAQVAETIAKITNVDLSTAITVSGDKAVAKLDVAALVQQIKDIADESKKLFASLKELDPNATPSKLELNLNLGAITAKSLEVPLSKELFNTAKENGIDKLALSMNGLALAMTPGTFNADTTLTVGKKETSAATSVTQLPLASGVFEFEFTSNGSKVTTFSNPVELRLSIEDSSRLDTEKLVLAKIVDGKLEFYGGKYNAKDKQLRAVRNSFSTYTVVENNVVFNDTASVKAWAGRQIEVAAAKGILEGRGDKEFVPNGTVTRAEFAKMIVKTFGLEDASAKASFTDVNDSDWFKPYVAAAVKSGLVNGREEGKFDPNGKITRAEMATIAARALQAVNGVKVTADVDSALKNFDDAKAIHDSLKAGVALSVGQGIVVGEEGNKFNPNADSTRAQAAVVIYRLLNK